MSKLGTAICLTALLASSAANAQWEYNWLIGVSGGWAEMTGDVNVTIEPTEVDVVFTDENRLRDDGSVWGAFVGYQARCNGWLAGVELNVDWYDKGDEHDFQTVLTDGTTFTYDAHYKRDTTVGLSGRLGFQTASWLLPYVRLGVETSRDKLDSFLTALVDVDDTFHAEAEGSRTNWRWVGGVGFEIPVPMISGLSGRAEYNYHSKGKHLEASGLGDDLLASTYIARGRPETHTAKISLVYNIM